jgi:hypothetical protein
MATFVTKTGALTTALLSGVFASSLLAQPVRAQEAAPAAPPPPPPPAVVAPEAAPPPPPPEVVAAPPAPTETVATTAKPSFKKMNTPAIWFRLDNRGQAKKGTADKKKIDGFVMGSEINVLFSGQVHEYVAWQANFVATFGNQSGSGKDITGSANVLDLIGQFNLHDSFNIWVGRMLVPSDRSNFSGPWFMSAWNYPGFFLPGKAPFGPQQGPSGRNDGATAWGQFLGGHVKYYAGAFDLHDLEAHALYSGRLNFTLLNPEPGYYHSSTYYGGKDIVALGISGQYKKGGSKQSSGMDPDPVGFTADLKNYRGISTDLLVEKTLGGAGTATLESAFYLYDGKYETLKNSWYVLASYLMPMEIGIGKFQPLIRLQQAKTTGQATGLPVPTQTWRLIDAAVSYVVDEYAMRIALNYQNADIGGAKANTVTLGIQIQK